MSTIDQLKDMGFPEERVKRAVEATDGGVEAALEWLIAHNDDPPAPSAAPTASAETADPSPSEGVINSYKCNDCDKLFRDMDALMFHATKSGHENFSESTDEIKPLTEEERKQKASELRDKIKAAQAKKAENEKKEAIEKERRRRDEGKKMLEMREKQQEIEMKAIAEERRRAKQEEQDAKNRVLEQIRLDKEARKAREQGQAPPQPTAPIHVAPPRPKVDYDKATIQIRLPSGQAIKQQFGADEPLAAVRLWLEMNHSNGQPFQLLVPFPRKLFTPEDYEAPLKALGLVPSASIVMTR